MGIALVVLGIALHLFALIAMLLAGGNSARAETDAEKAAAAIFFLASDDLVQGGFAFFDHPLHALDQFQRALVCLGHGLQGEGLRVGNLFKSRHSAPGDPVRQHIAESFYHFLASR